MMANFWSTSLLLSLTIVCMRPFSVVAEETNTVVRTVDRETMNKMLKLKTKVASGIHTPSRDAGYPGISRLVDTEIYEDGSVKYYVRRGTADGRGMLTLPGKYTDDISLTYARGSGELVMISEVKYEADRIELSISPRGADEKSYGRIKLMTGKGYKDWSAARILAFLDRAVVIPSVEDRPMWVQQFKKLTSSLPKLETAAVQGDPESELAANDELQADYTELAVLKQSLTAVGDDVVVGDTRNYSSLAQRIADGRPKLAAEVAVIQAHKAAVAKQVRVQSLQAQLGKKKSEIIQALSNIDKQRHRTVAGSPQRATDLATLKSKLQEFDQINQELQNDGNDVAGSREFTQSVQKKVAEMQHEIEAGKLSAAVHGLDMKFQAMTVRRAEITSSYANAFGTSAADGIKSDLRQLLNQMLANREEAMTQGSGVAKQQCTELREAIQKLH